MRVLIVKTSSMGDVLHTLPALTDAWAFPGIRFDWVVEEGFAQIPSWHEAVDRVIPVAIRRWRKAWFSRRSGANARPFAMPYGHRNMTRLSMLRVWSKAPRWSPGWRTA
jgi:heptosyltransferase-1